MSHGKVVFTILSKESESDMIVLWCDGVNVSILRDPGQTLLTRYQYTSTKVPSKRRSHTNLKLRLSFAVMVSICLFQERSGVINTPKFHFGMSQRPSQSLNRQYRLMTPSGFSVIFVRPRATGDWYTGFPHKIYSMRDVFNCRFNNIDNKVIL